MIPIKTKEEIRVMQEGGRKLRKILQIIIQETRPGVTTECLDRLAEKLIEKQKGQPSFQMVKGYKWATCMSVNDCVVHGVPNKRKLIEGDILSIDVGFYYKGFHTDCAKTILITDLNNIYCDKREEKFLQVGQEALKKAISQIKPANRLGHISGAIQETVEEVGYNVVKQLVGHGVGKKLHEPPEIPCFLKGRIEETPKLAKGMILAVEVIYNAGTSEVILDKKDGWTIRTKDGKIAALFEKTVAVMPYGPLVLT